MMMSAILNTTIVLTVAAGSPQKAPIVIVMPAPDYWQTARHAPAVVRGTVCGSAPAQRQLTLAVTAVLKGKDVPAQVVLSWPYENTLPTGQDCLVFLSAGQPSGYRVSAVVSDARTIGEAMAIVRDVLAVDACDTDRARCQMLVELVLRDGPSRRYAAHELEGFREEEYLALLEPLSKDPATLGTYVALVALNRGQSAADLLLKHLSTNDKSIRWIALSALGHQRTSDPLISRRVAAFLHDEDAPTRALCVNVLRERGYRETLPQIAVCLADPSTHVRQAALTWPWQEYVSEDGEVVARVRACARSQEPLERLLACHALTRMQDTRSFYRLWLESLLSGYQQGYGPIDLGPFWRAKPFTVSALIAWPTLLLACLLVVMARLTKTGKLLRLLEISAVCGYAAGVAFGYFARQYWTDGSGFHVFVLMPALTVPFAVTVAIAALGCREWRRRRRRAGPRGTAGGIA